MVTKLPSLLSLNREIEAQRILASIMSDDFILLEHAIQRAEERSISIENVIHCAKTCFHCEWQEETDSMGKETEKTMSGVGELGYVEVRHVPMSQHEGLGYGIDSKVLGEIEKRVARELILERYRIRGKELRYFRSIFALSQRELAEKLHLSHVAVLKWEKAYDRPLDLINEVAIKALLSGMLGLKIPASLESLTGNRDIPEKLILDYRAKVKKKTA